MYGGDVFSVLAKHKNGEYVRASVDYKENGKYIASIVFPLSEEYYISVELDGITVISDKRVLVSKGGKFR